MGVRLLSRWARAPMLSMGIDPAKRPARDARKPGMSLALAERTRVSRWARAPMLSMGIDPEKRPARDIEGAMA